MSTSPEGTLARRLPAWTRIPPQQMLSLLLVVAVGFALVLGGWMYSTTPDYRVLYANLSDRDGGAVIAALQQMNIPYKFADGGGALLVPENQVHDARLKLAAQGLPKGGITGFELMEAQRFGASQFVEQVNYQRGLEGELARSIQALQQVQSARVHLALTRNTGFLRDQPPASASVLVHLYPGRTLDPMQVGAIVHLVTNSVPGLSTKNVSVVDQNGTLLSGESNVPGSGVDKAQLKYRNDMEQGYVQRIEAILVPIIGSGNVKAQVSADLDFSEIEHAEEVYKPNQRPEAASVRAQQTSERSGGGGGAVAGVPGAVSNQPPGTAIAPITADQTRGTAVAGSGGASSSSTHQRDASVTYEVDKSIRHTKLAQGRLKRLSVAVVVNDRTVLEGGKPVAKPLTDAEKEQITELVKGVVGYDKERGDVLSVMNSAFKVRDPEPVVNVPLWKQPSTIDMAKDSGKFLLIAALVLFALLKVLKPMVTNLTRVPPMAAPMELLPNTPTPALQQTQRYENSLQTARQLAKQDPKIVANVVKDWVAGNEQ
jgi:flagellar M-ring protein FliF